MKGAIMRYVWFLIIVLLIGCTDIQEPEYDVRAFQKNGNAPSIAVSVTVKAFLQGAYEGNGEMHSYLSPTIVDSVFIQLREDKTTVVAEQFALLNTSGNATALFGDIGIKNAYIVLKHRNHLAVMSKHKQNVSSGSLFFDFSDVNNIYGGDAKNLGDGNYALYSGDANGDGIVEIGVYPIEGADLLVWRSQNGYAGYLSADCQIDGDTDASDLNLFMRPNDKKQTQVP